MPNKERGELFDKVAPLYDEVRPDYSEELYADIEEYSKLPDNARVLEIGCGTGKATTHFAERGYGILCVEKGESLANFAKDKFKSYGNVEIIVSDFESHRLEDNYFDLIFSATAFHWVDDEVKYEKTARILK